MIHIIRTTYSDLDFTYRGEEIILWENFPYRVLQGNTIGPKNWNALGFSVFNFLRNMGFTCKLISSLSKQLLFLATFTYVAASDLFQSGSYPISVLASIQDLINIWGSLINATWVP